MTLTATTLAADLGVNDLVMTIAAAMSTDSHERGFVVQIEAEYILVERRVARTNPQIVRGFLGTERAAHDSGEDVTPVVLVAQTDPPVEPPSESGGGGGGVTVTGTAGGSVVAVTGIQLAGQVVDSGGGVATQVLALQLVTVDVAFDDPDLGTGVTVAALPEDAILQDAWVELASLFIHGGDQRLTFGFGAEGNPLGGATFAIGGNASADQGTDFNIDTGTAAALSLVSASDGVRYVPTRALQDTSLLVSVENTTSTIGIDGGDLDDSQTTFSVSVKPKILPAAPFTLLCEAEEIRVTARDADVNVFPTELTVTRGYNGTTPAAHSGEGVTVISPDPWVPTAGLVRVYAIIATPAS